MTHNNGARVILAVANEADDDFIWDQMKSLQADMFAAGPVSIKVAYFGREGAGMTARPFISTRWATAAMTCVTSSTAPEPGASAAAMSTSPTFSRRR
jgi:hypothetical protein